MDTSLAAASEERARGRYLNTVEYFQLQQTLALQELLSTPLAYSVSWVRSFWYTLSHGHVSQLYHQFSHKPWPERDSAAGLLMNSLVKVERVFWIVVAGFDL
jgi:hypothetical protein